jgi:hypothetical protein
VYDSAPRNASGKLLLLMLIIAVEELDSMIPPPLWPSAAELWRSEAMALVLVLVLLVMEAKLSSAAAELWCSEEAMALVLVMEVKL